MGKPDLISRRADFDRGDKDNNDVVFLKEEWLMRGVVVTERDELVTKVKVLCCNLRSVLVLCLRCLSL